MMVITTASCGYAPHCSATAFPWWYGLLHDEQVLRLATVPEEQEIIEDGDAAGLVSAQG